MVIVSSAWFDGRTVPAVRDRPGPGPGRETLVSSAADAELLDQRAVARLVLLLHVVEKRAALGNHLQEATPGMVVLGVGLEVVGEVVDALGQDGDLDLRRAGIAGFVRMFLDERGLALGRDRHRASFLVDLEEAGAASPRERPGRDVVQ